MAASMLSFMHSVHGIDLEEREREQGRRRVSSYPEREHVRTFAMLLDIFAMLHHSNKFIPITTAVVLSAIGTDRFAVIAKAGHAIAPGATLGLGIGARQRAVELAAPARRPLGAFRCFLALQALEWFGRTYFPGKFRNIPMSWWSPFCKEKNFRKVALQTWQLAAVLLI